MSATHIPRTLDGARVLSVAPARAGQLGFHYGTGDSVAVCYYVIAQYEGDEPRAYLFAVSEDYEVIGDTLWDSPAETAQVAFNSGNVSSHFEPPTPN